MKVDNALVNLSNLPIYIGWLQANMGERHMKIMTLMRPGENGQVYGQARNPLAHEFLKNSPNFVIFFGLLFPGGNKVMIF